MKTRGSGNGPGCWVIENWDSGRETENKLNRVLGRRPWRPPGSDGGISDSDGESNPVTKPWLERWSWSLGGESRKSIAGTGGRQIGLKFLHMRNAHLKHLDVRANITGAL